MKYLKSYKTFETGEWSRDVDWDWVKENPEEAMNDEEVSWILKLEETLEDVRELLNNKEDLIIKDIKGFDKYQGPYANVIIKGKNYTVWTTEHNGIWIDNFPVDNTSDDDKLPGFEGNVEQVAEAINSL